MTLVVNNDSGTDVNLFVDKIRYFIKSNEHNVAINCDCQKCVLSIKRAKKIPSASYKKMLLSEILGGMATLFVGSLAYTLDVSSKYCVVTYEKDVIRLNVIRKTNRSNGDIVYDAICIESPDLSVTETTYWAENKEEIFGIYKKTRRIGHICLYAILLVLFTLIGAVIIYPLLLALYLTIKSFILKVASLFISS